jgi:hypothetical protein
MWLNSGTGGKNMKTNVKRKELINTIDMRNKTTSEITIELKRLGLGLDGKKSKMVKDILFENKKIFDNLKDK